MSAKEELVLLAGERLCGVSTHAMAEARQSPRDVLNRLGLTWCRVLHDAPMWPLTEGYRCRTCGRLHPVPWAQPHAA